MSVVPRDGGTTDDGHGSVGGVDPECYMPSDLNIQLHGSDHGVREFAFTEAAFFGASQHDADISSRGVADFDALQRPFTNFYVVITIAA